MPDRSPMRIAVVLQTPKLAQSAIYIGYRLLGGALAAGGHHLDIVAPDDFRIMERAQGRMVPVVYPFVVARWFRRNRHQYDAVLFHSYAGWRALQRSDKHGAATAVVFHGVEPLYHEQLRREAMAGGASLSWRYRLLQEGLMPWMLARSCRRADLVACLNSAEAAYLERRRWYKTAPPRVLSHGLPASFFAPPRERREVRTLLFVGQWLPMKGVRYLRDAAVTLLSRYHDMQLVCAGTLASAEDVLHDFPEGVRSRIRVYSTLEQDALRALYQEADAFIFPSLYEAFSRALVEAMAAGLPIVCTRVGVAADALRDGESALIVASRDTPALVAGIERLCSDPVLRVELGKAARRAAEAFQLHRAHEQTLAFLAELAAMRPPRADAVS